MAKAKVKSRAEVLEQVRKLLALSSAEQNDSEQECDVALTKAHQLLEQHGLDMAEVMVEEGGAWEIIDWMDDPRTQYDTWNRHLQYAAATLFNCKSYRMSRHWNRTQTYRLVSLGLIGEATDVAMAREVWPWLIKKAKTAAKAYAGNGWDKKHRNFAEAFASRIVQRAMKMMEEDKAKTAPERTVTNEQGVAVTNEQGEEQTVCTALVVAGKEEAIDTWMGDQKIKMGKARTRGHSGARDGGARAAGAEAGNAVDLNFAKGIKPGGNQGRLNG